MILSSSSVFSALMLSAHPPIVGATRMEAFSRASPPPKGVLMSQMAAVVSTWRTDVARTKAFPGRIDPSVTVTVTAVGVVEMVDVESGITVVSWVLTELSSSGAFAVAARSGRELREWTVPSWAGVADSNNSCAPSAR